MQSVCVKKQVKTEDKVCDLPPSYSTADLFSLGVSVSDHLQPPPEYLDLERPALSRVRLSHVMLPVRSPAVSRLSSGFIMQDVGRAFLRQDSGQVQLERNLKKVESEETLTTIVEEKS